MVYTDIISLEEAKNYLRIDDDLTEDDNSIIRMIEASLRYIEKYTDVIFYSRDIDFLVEKGELKVYKYPINTDLSTLTEYTTERKGLYTNFCSDSYDTVDLILNVGFTDESEIPQDLLEVAFEMIDLYYYGEKDGKPIQKKLSALSMDTLVIHKRFWL
jgi:hypothetical protein